MKKNKINHLTKLKTQVKNLKKALEDMTWGAQKTNEGIKLLYQELEEKNKKLMELDRIKNNLIATVSHDIGTPLSVIKGFFTMVAKEISAKLNKEQKKQINIINDCIIYVTEIIVNLLDMSKLESGKMKFLKTNINLSFYIKEAVSFFVTRSRTKKITLEVKIQDNLPQVFADGERILQVLTNLLGNAVKFTPKGGKISIRAQKKNKFIEVSITDTGPGIPLTDQKRIFEPFEQIKYTIDPRIKSVGLGLSITKSIIEQHDSKIWVKSPISTDGKGSKFSFSLKIFNRAIIFRESLACSIQKAKETGIAFCLGIIEIENFKILQNSTRSKEIQSLLENIEKKIKSIFRESDFIILYRENAFSFLIEGKQEMFFSIEERLKEFSDIQEFPISNKPFKVLFNYGLAYYPDEVGSAKELIMKAENNLSNKRFEKKQVA